MNTYCLVKLRLAFKFNEIGKKKWIKDFYFRFQISLENALYFRLPILSETKFKFSDSFSKITETPSKQQYLPRYPQKVLLVFVQQYISSTRLNLTDAFPPLASGSNLTEWAGEQFVWVIENTRYINPSFHEESRDYLFIT